MGKLIVITALFFNIMLIGVITYYKVQKNPIDDVIEYIGPGRHVVLTTEINRSWLPETWRVYSFSTQDISIPNLKRFRTVPFDYAIILNLDNSMGEDQRIKQWKDEIKEYIETKDEMNVCKMQFGSTTNKYRKYLPYNADCYTVIKRIKPASRTHFDKSVIGSKSTYSYNGRWTLDEIAGYLNSQGVREWMPTDLWESRFELYGKVIEQKSITTMGVKNYLNDLKRLQKQYPNMKIIPGAEVMNGYYWTGSLFKFNLTLNSGRKYYAKISDDGELKWFKDIKSDSVPDKIKHQFAYYQPSVSFYEYGKVGYTSRLDEFK